MSRLELKLPPLLVVLLLAAVAWAIARLAPQLSGELPAARGFALFLLSCGVAVAAAGVIEFHRARTTVDPMRPANASAVVSRGIFGFTRNPMYLGMLLALIGWIVFLSNVLAAVTAPLFIFYMNRFQILPEERFLREKFGAPYEAYRRAVRRWL